MSKRLLLSVFSLFIGSFFVLPTVQAATPTKLNALVRVEIHDSNDKLLSFGTGVLIDPDGRILTSYRTVKAWDQNRNLTGVVCLTKNEVDPPSCTLRAALLAVRSAQDLALLQVREVNANGNWMSVEENVLRNRFQFTPAKTSTTVMTDEGVQLGQPLTVFTYPGSGSNSISQLNTQAMGFIRTQVKGKSTPALVKVDGVIATQTYGGIYFNASDTLVGISTQNSGDNKTLSTFTSLPVINTFLSDTLGRAYVAHQTPFVLTGSLNGVMAGPLQTTTCPAYSGHATPKETCRCNDGFFAVGNVCMLGQTYCQISYPKGVEYDSSLRTCMCPSVDGHRICAPRVSPTAPKPVPPTVPKPVAPPVAAKPTSTPALKTFTCPANASYNATSWACTCDKGFVKNTAKNACVRP